MSDTEFTTAAERALESMRRTTAAARKLTPKLAEVACIGWQAIEMMRAAELASIREHPDLAEVEFWLDAYYGTA